MAEKKMVIFYILEILKKHTDSEHKLSQKEIETILKNEYGIKANRKSIKSNIMNLIDYGFVIDYRETVRISPNRKTGEMEETIIMSDFSLVRDIDDSELRLLIDSVLFAPHISDKQSKDLIIKLENQTSNNFKSRVKHIVYTSKNKTDNKQLFHTIDMVDEAIAQKKKIKFKYGEYDTDLKLKPKRTSTGEDRTYIVTPYQMAAKEGKYYLICNYDRYDDISNYRMDRILDIELIEEKARPFKQLKGANNMPLNLQEYMNEHIFMYSGDTVRAKLKIVNPMITDMVDIFGKDIKFSNQTDTTIEVDVKANEQSLLQFAQRYAPDVIVMEPENLRNKIIDQLKRGVEGYENQ